jgi:hypothetical protein
MKRTWFPAAGLLLGACAIPNVIAGLDDRSPPPEFGRPAWVRVCAGIGAWTGGIVGGVFSVVLLPVTYPISLLASDGLGEHSSGEFLFFPALGGAAIGHCLLGAPPDLLDFVFRRAWIDSPDPVNSYELVPLEGPIMLRAEPAAPSANPANPTNNQGKSGGS